MHVNGIAIDLTNQTNITVRQACEQVGVEIPRFCYHERLLVAGNCRMCLVEVAGSPKPQASCALPVSQGMKVFTDTPRVKKARELVREFLLLNHPLDCPICDQGGECDRQDESMAFGSDRGRGHGRYGNGIEPKRGVEDRDWNPRVKAIMTRCIHCTRCIRFSSEIAGVSDRGTSGRGVSTEVGTYVHKMRNTELSGNVVDLCPVGALTSKSYGFKARPWELKSMDRMNPRDGLGTMVRVQSRDQRILRVLPIENDDVNGGWRDDKSRYSIDGSQMSRLSSALAHGGKAIVEREVAMKWFEEHIESILSSKEEIHVGIHSGLPIEYHLNAVNWVKTMRQHGVKAYRFSEQSHEFNKPSGMTESLRTSVNRDRIGKSDLIVLCGLDRRKELPLVNARIRESHLRDQTEIIHMGPSVDLTYPVIQMGLTSEGIEGLLNGTHPLSSKLMRAKRPRFLMGSKISAESSSLLRRSRMISHYGSVQKGWKVMNPIHMTASGLLGGLIGMDDLKFPMIGYESSLRSVHLVTIGLDQQDLLLSPFGNRVLRSAKSLVYLGSYMDPRVDASRLAIPMPSWYDRSGHHLTTYGDVKQVSPVRGGGRGDGFSSDLPGWRSEPIQSKRSAEEKGLQPLGLGLRIGLPSHALRPTIVDYHMEGHPVSRRSSRMHQCSILMNSGKSFVQ